MMNLLQQRVYGEASQDEEKKGKVKHRKSPTYQCPRTNASIRHHVLPLTIPAVAQKHSHRK
jgi:hypothetical protein